MMSLIGGPCSSHIHGDRKWDGGCQGLGGEGRMGTPFNGDRVSVFQDEKVLELDGGEGCTTKSM